LFGVYVGARLSVDNMGKCKKGKMALESQGSRLMDSKDPQGPAEQQVQGGSSSFKYKALFEGAGVAIWDCDFSQVYEALEEARKLNSDVRRYLLEHPELVRQCIAKIRVRDVNERTVSLYRARSKEELKARLAELFPPESERVFAEEFLALYEGRRHFQDHKVVRALDGEKLCVLATVTAVPGGRPLENVIVSVMDVTVQEKSREALKESEAKFRDIFERNVVAMNLWDAEGRVLQANEAFLRLTGYTRKDVDAGLLNCEMLTAETDWHASAQARRQALEAGKFEPFAKDIVSRDGTRVPVLVSGGALAGHADRGVSFLFDLREQVRAADAIRKKSTYARLLRDVAVAARAASDPRDVLSNCLEGLCSELDFPIGHAFLVEDNRVVPSQLWHCGPDQVPRFAEFMVATAEISLAGRTKLMQLALSSDVSTWQWPEEADLAACPRGRAAATCGIKTMIILPLFAQGKPVAVLELGSCTKLAQPDEDLVKILVAFSAELSRVFERQQAQSALQKREELYRTLVKSFPGGYVIVFDKELRCVLADGNQLRQPAESAVGRKVTDVIETDSVPDFVNACLGALHCAPSYFEMVLPNGRIHHVDVVPIGSDGELAMIISHDITTLKSTETALRESESQLRSYAERLLVMARRLIKAHEEERTRIARELHDDFNQRIAAACISLSNLLHDNRLRNSDIRRQLVDIKEVISALSQDIRSMSHSLHPAVLEHMGTTAALRAQSAEFKRIHKVALSFECDCEECLDRVDSEISICLYRVLQEALTNIRKHSGASQVAVVVHANSEQVEMRVIDNGMNFDPVEARSSGLGLTNMEERVKLLNGSFYVFSKPNSSNTIVVTIPQNEGGTRPARETLRGRTVAIRGCLHVQGGLSGEDHKIRAMPRRPKKNKTIRSKAGD
jgi:PAS domain S-box-containing protein